MKKLISILLVISVVFFISCDKFKFYNKGTLKGTIGIYEGNCMPQSGVPPCKPKPIATTIAVTTPSEFYQKKKLIAKTVSTEDGSYEITLPEGEYSLFLLDGDEFICEHWKCPEQCYCTPFIIKKDSITIVNANIDHAYW